ncbi:hypothetical protein C1H46_025494 [Malus baccata]|uniref:Uncharacterized protein n=1 Tax=Malus baccata TaxID=106549 RepID=A0A540LR86_MALBA|nr:hypothetical protein C1H46_025494 [Malus baccata]
MGYICLKMVKHCVPQTWNKPVPGGRGGTQKHPKSVPWNNPFHPFLAHQTRDGTPRSVPSRPVARTKRTLRAHNSRSDRPAPNRSNTLADRSEQPGSQIQTQYYRTQIPFPFPRRKSSDQNLPPRSSDQKQPETDSRRSPWIQRPEGAAGASSKAFTGSSCDATPSTSPSSSPAPSSASGL